MILALILTSCTEETEELAYCIRNPEECQEEEGSSQELLDGIEVDSTATVSKLAGRDKEYNSGN